MNTMKAIQVKYLPVTNMKPARVVAMAGGKNRLIKSVGAYDSFEDAAHAAAHHLALRLQWYGRYIGGTLPNGDIVYVNNKGIHSLEGSFNVTPASEGGFTEKDIFGN